MTRPLPSLQTLSSIDRTRAANEFIAVVKCLLVADGSPRDAANFAEARHELSRVVEVLRTAVPGAGLGDSSWAGSMFSGMVAGFAESLKHYGAFDAMLPSMVRVPINSRVGLVTAGFSASIVGEGLPKPVRKLSTTAPVIEPQKATVICVVSADFLRFAAAGTEALLGNELRASVAVTVDQRFLEIITDGLTPLSSSGSTAANVREDLRDMAATIATSVRSKLFLIVSPADAKGLALMGDASGAAAFPMTPQGGLIGGITVVVSDGLAAGTAVMVDASGIGAAADRIELDVSREAAVEMADSALNQAAITTGSPPTSVGTTLTSLFQTNSAGLRVGRHFGATRLRNDAVAVANVNYSGAGSP